ncbi:MAG: UDP-glucose--hexose-1-phosphate uridylyltransferase [Actinomycetota bacterium]|nr:UDP-glucose--hexose-1-phosphate uridylyltransferase [Actinomycetota bacterium]
MSRQPHRRLNQLTGDWVLVSPQRAARPWRGTTEPAAAVRPPRYEPGCYLCPGNRRAGDRVTPSYGSTYVFDNDFPALLPEPAAPPAGASPLLVAKGVRGICRVVCYSPRHDLTLGEMPAPDIAGVIGSWTAQYAELGGRGWVEHVLIFENRGAMTGASNPHPHGQIWAEDHLPREPLAETRRFDAYGGCLLCDYLAAELACGDRVVLAGEHFVALVPFWAAWPYEVLVLPRVHAGALPDLSDRQRDGLAEVISGLTAVYDALFDTPFPYSAGLHQRPTDGRRHPGWHLHAHYVPPLLRSASVRKYFGGYELLAQPQRDLPPEEAAARLRAVTPVPAGR